MHAKRNPLYLINTNYKAKKLHSNSMKLIALENRYIMLQMNLTVNTQPAALYGHLLVTDSFESWCAVSPYINFFCQTNPLNMKTLWTLKLPCLSKMVVKKSWCSVQVDGGLFAWNWMLQTLKLADENTASDFLLDSRQLLGRCLCSKKSLCLNSYVCSTALSWEQLRVQIVNRYLTRWEKISFKKWKSLHGFKRTNEFLFVYNAENAT